jgi:hypothetical protein
MRSRLGALAAHLFGIEVDTGIYNLTATSYFLAE